MSLVESVSANRPLAAAHYPRNHCQNKRLPTSMLLSLVMTGLHSVGSMRRRIVKGDVKAYDGLDF